MDHLSKEQETRSHRLGFHYFCDVERFQPSDAKLWIRKLKDLSANWIILKNPPGRAIPEEFIRQIAQQDIKIIINFEEIVGNFEGFSEIETLLHVYGKWGVKYACLFKEPNLRKNWGDTKWVENDIVAVHADLFLEFARTCTENKIQPVFSTLYPGGDYLDLAFLERSLRIIQEKGDPIIQKKLVVSAYGWHHHHPLPWGEGGKARWPNSRLLGSRPTDQDHRGLRLYEWYSEIDYAVYGRKLPIIIFEAGNAGRDYEKDNVQAGDWSGNLDAVIDLLSGRNVFDQDHPNQLHTPIAPEVIGCCAFILSAQEKKSIFPYRWFTEKGKALPPARKHLPQDEGDLSSQKYIEEISPYPAQLAYQRYLFIDQSQRANTPLLLEKLDPYIKRHKPFIGFSLIEGCKAAFLIVITDDEKTFREDNASLIPDDIIVKIVTTSALDDFINE